MAKYKELHTSVVYLFVFLVLLSVRYCDGHQEIVYPIILEYKIFYLMLYVSLILSFRYTIHSSKPVFIYSLLAIIMYMYVTYLAMLFPGYERADAYPPAENFWSNYFTFFIVTGDAGFWQIFRIFSTGILVLLIFIINKVSISKSVIVFLLVYSVGMLITHPYYWVYFPPVNNNISHIWSLNSIDVIIIYFSYANIFSFIYMAYIYSGRNNLRWLLVFLSSVISYTFLIAFSSIYFDNFDTRFLYLIWLSGVFIYSLIFIFDSGLSPISIFLLPVLLLLCFFVFLLNFQISGFMVFLYFFVSILIMKYIKCIFFKGAVVLFFSVSFYYFTVFTGYDSDIYYLYKF